MVDDNSHNHNDTTITKEKNMTLGIVGVLIFTLSLVFSIAGSKGLAVIDKSVSRKKNGRNN